MRGGVLGIELDVLGAVPAPPSGVLLGTSGEGRPVSLRLFCSGGVRVALATELLPVQLAVIRAAAAGTPVQVVTGRPHCWQPLLRHDRTLHAVGPVEVRTDRSGPALVVDDRSGDVPRGPAEVRPWQCRVDVRSQWMPSEVGAFARADLTVFGRLPIEVTASVAASFAVPAATTEPLGRLRADTFAVARRGRVEYVTLNATAAEARLLEAVRA